MVLANIVVPSAGTSGTSRYTIADDVLLVHRADTLETVVGDDIVTEYVHVLLYHWSEVSDKVLYILYEVRINVILQASDTVVVLNESSARSLFHNVEHVLVWF